MCRPSVLKEGWLKRGPAALSAAFKHREAFYEAVSSGYNQFWETKIYFCDLEIDVQNDSLIEWKIFDSIIHTRSVSQTAKALGLTPSFVSSRLTKLEEELGQPLFGRDSRPFTVTSAGAAIQADVRELLLARKRIERFFIEKSSEDSAILRVMIGNSFRHFIPRLIVHYAQMHPNLRFNMISPVDIADFQAEKADIIAVSGNVTLPKTVMLSRGRMIFVPVASPAYLKAYGEINEPEDLRKHRVFSNLYANRFAFSLDYPLKKEGRIVTFSGLETIRWSSVDMALQAVRDGLGISPSMPLFHCIDDLESGRLVPVLNGWHRPSQPNFIACRKSDWNISYVQQFMVWLSEELTGIQASAEKRFEACFGKALLDEYGA